VCCCPYGGRLASAAVVGATLLNYGKPLRGHRVVFTGQWRDAEIVAFGLHPSVLLLWNFYDWFRTACGEEHANRLRTFNKNGITLYWVSNCACRELNTGLEVWLGRYDRYNLPRLPKSITHAIQKLAVAW